MITFSDQIKRLDRSREGIPLLQALLASAPAAERSDECPDDLFVGYCIAVATAHGIKCVFNPEGKSILEEMFA